MTARRWLLLLFAALLAARLCHLHVLWAEEGLPLAAAQQMARGHVLYRDLWFDKPPLLALVYLFDGARDGWPLRVLGAVYGWLACLLVWCCARDRWGEREARWASGLLAFFLIFDTPSAVTPLAADLLLVAPHLAAVWLAQRGRSFWAGVAAGAGFLANAKSVLVLLACAVWAPASIPLLAAGFAVTTGAGAAWLAAMGALPAAIDQVWRWGRLYAEGTFLADPVRNALARSANWAGFHAALMAAAAVALVREQRDRGRWMLWIVLCAAGVAAGWRFFPRYFFQLLPVLVLLAARGFTLLPRRVAWAMALLLLIPAVRFGPRYVLLASGRSENWADTAMDRDSRAAARLIAGDSLFVWGFRPELYAYTGLPAASRFLDSQPLTGVPADRHLTQSDAVAPELARANRAELIRSSPAIIVDGLGLYNPRLAITNYPDLQPWLAGYREVARTAGTVIYRRLR